MRTRCNLWTFLVKSALERSHDFPPSNRLQSHWQTTCCSRPQFPSGIFRQLWNSNRHLSGRRLQTTSTRGRHHSGWTSFASKDAIVTCLKWILAELIDNYVLTRATIIFLVSAIATLCISTSHLLSVFARPP